MVIWYICAFQFENLQHLAETAEITKYSFGNFLLQNNPLCAAAVGQKILKSPGQKKQTREIQSINFTTKFFLIKFHFLQFQKKAKKSIFEPQKSLKLPKMQFQDFIFLFDFAIFLSVVLCTEHYKKLIQHFF